MPVRPRSPLDVTAPMTARELVGVVGIAFVAVPVVTLALASTTWWARPFWADEALTWMLAGDPSLSHGLAALAGGVDTNAPLLHVMLHGIGAVFGHSGVVYRAFAAMSVALATLGLYVGLRRRVDRSAATVGCAAFASMPIVIAHAAEARFYGPFLAASIWTSVALMWRRDRATVANAAGVALASAALCSIHYFGILALLAIAIGEVVTSRVGRAHFSGPVSARDHATRRPTEVGLPPWVARLYPTLAGVVTTLCLYPLLETQRAAALAIGGTWVPDTFWTNLSQTLPDLLGVGTIVGLVVLLVLRRLRRGARHAESRGFAPPASPDVQTHGFGRDQGSIDLRSLPFAALLIYPLLLLAFDRLVQPVIAPRYFVPMLPALAATVAVGCATLRPIDRRALLTLFLCLGGAELLRIRAAIASPSPRSAMAIVASLESAAQGPIVTDWRGYAQPIFAARPDLRDRLHFLDDPCGDDPLLARSIPYERGMMHIVHDFYGWPRFVKREELSATPFTLVTEFPESAQAYFAGQALSAKGPLTFGVSGSSEASAR